MARKFLWAIALVTVLIVGGAILWRLFAQDLMRVAFLPQGSYAAAIAPPAPDYAAATSWIARPGLAGNPALWAPPGYTAAPKPAAAVFFVAPTAWLSRSGWNAPLDDAGTNTRLDSFVRMQATVFNGVAEIWSPRYRQASFGSLLTPGPDADKALALAFTDVERAFDAFLKAQPADRPIILAGHSQGARHLLSLLATRRAALGDRLVAAYAVGWPVALPDDLAATGMPACTGREQSGCLASWQSFALDGDLDRAQQGLAAVRDIAGVPLGRRAMLCTNPLSGGPGGAGPDRNAGTLVGEALRPRAVGASCNPRGLLLIGPAPTDTGPFVLPGGNFHLYDYALFWANIRADVEARLSAYGAARGIAPGGPDSI